MANLRRVATQNIAEQLGLPYYTATIYANLKYASQGELIWAAKANAHSLRQAAREAPDRYTSEGKPVNPFWYHSEVDTTAETA